LVPSKKPLEALLPLTPDERILRAKIAAHTLHSQVDGHAHTAPARAAFDRRFDLEVDPDGVLPPDERARRAGHARKAYFTGLALKSAKVRRRNAEIAQLHDEAS
jgi:hypothetical protein